MEMGMVSIKKNRYFILIYKISPTAKLGLKENFHLKHLTTGIAVAMIIRAQAQMPMLYSSFFLPITDPSAFNIFLKNGVQIQY